MHDNLKGNALTEVTFLILLSVYTPKHGYLIMQFIETKTQGRLCLGAGTLYGALNNLVQKKWIYQLDTENNRKKEYLITELGKKAVETELNRLYQIIEIAQNIIKE